MPNSPPVVLITGSDRGIGFALTQEFTTRGWRVLATCRDPVHATALQEFATAHASVTIETLDVTDNAAIDRLALKYRGQPIDVLVNNAGIMGNYDGQKLSVLDADEFERVMRINSYAPLRMAQAFLDSVAASQQKKIVSITSGVASLWLAPQYQAPYYYSISKSALNMAMRLLQGEVSKRGVLVGIVTPGPVDTDMQKEYRAGAAQAGTPITTPVLSPAESSRAVVSYIENLSAAQSGRFYSYSGAEVPW